MRHPVQRKLTLHRDTVRNLSEHEAALVVGGETIGGSAVCSKAGDTCSYLFCGTTISLLMTCETRTREEA